jgi:hypothetical protein
MMLFTRNVVVKCYENSNFVMFSFECYKNVSKSNIGKLVFGLKLISVNLRLPARFC